MKRKGRGSYKKKKKEWKVWNNFFGGIVDDEKTRSDEAISSGTRIPDYIK